MFAAFAPLFEDRISSSMSSQPLQQLLTIILVAKWQTEAETTEKATAHEIPDLAHHGDTIHTRIALALLIDTTTSANALQKPLPKTFPSTPAN